MARSRTVGVGCTAENTAELIGYQIGEELRMAGQVRHGRRVVQRPVDVGHVARA